MHPQESIRNAIFDATCRYARMERGISKTAADLGVMLQNLGFDIGNIERKLEKAYEALRSLPDLKEINENWENQVKNYTFRKPSKKLLLVLVLLLGRKTCLLVRTVLLLLLP